MQSEIRKSSNLSRNHPQPQLDQLASVTCLHHVYHLRVWGSGFRGYGFRFRVEGARV